MVSDIAGPKYIHWYDGVVKVVKENHPNIKFIGNCHAGQGSGGNASIWREFLNQSAHAPGTPWPIDAVSFHGYASGYAHGASTPPAVLAAREVIEASTVSAKVLRYHQPVSTSINFWIAFLRC
jgi:hypothetical protein